VNARRALTAAYLVLLAAVLAAAALRPFAFQKANSIRVTTGPIPSIDGGESFDVYGVLSGIPSDHDDATIWDVDPDAKYRNMLEGRGNCSNLVFGLARHLQLEGFDFQIVHLMRPSTFLVGTGHTVLRTRFRLEGQEQVGIVDIFAGGVPRAGGRFLDVDDLRRGPIPDLTFSSWGGRPDRARQFYRDGLGEVEIGWIPGQEVAEYFDFVQRFYVPLGNRLLEKYVYDGLALLLGRYPEIHVSDVRPLAAGNPIAWPFYVCALWLLRSAIVMLPLAAWLEWRARRSS
jgi:hypothetical protein